LNEPKIFRAIMLSSTFTDLEEHRQKAIEAIAKYDYMPRVMEFSGARVGADVIETSLQMVRDAAAYVGIISHKYGQTPSDGALNPDGLSITELEFNEAMRLNRPIILFVMSDKHKLTKADIEVDSGKQKKLDDFRERAKRMRSGSEVHRVYGTFESLEQFKDVAIAIGNLVRDLGQSVPSANPVGDIGSRQTISNIPINVPRHFLGRDDDLAAIDAALKRGDGRAAVTALHGLRGVGKTALAAAYAERHQQDYRATWWIRAETDTTMRADLVGLGVQLKWVAEDIPEETAVKAVLDRLPREGPDILLVYDNARTSRELAPFLPRGAGPRIIITSNAPDWGGVAAPVEIEVWPKEVGADFLTARTGRAVERDAGLALSAALGGLPLAHEQAAAYCERLGLPLSEYATKFANAPGIYLDNAGAAPEQYHNGLTVSKTFALAIEEAAELHEVAEALIAYAALLAPEPIPLFLFAEGREKFSEPFASALAGDGLDEAVGALRAFALVDRESIPDERDPSIAIDTIRLHRLVREVATARTTAEARAEIRCELIAATARVYPGDVHRNPAAWPRARRLDAIALALVGGSDDLTEGSEISAATLLDGLSNYRHGALAAYAEARKLSERALAIREKVLGPDHPDTASSLNNLGYLLQAQGDLAGALPYFERALAIREKALGLDHPDTARSLNNLGALLDSQGDLTGARPYYERALAINEKTLGPDHPDTARSLNNLGYLLQTQGDLTGARPYYERALGIFEKKLGVAHPHARTVVKNLAHLYDKLKLRKETRALRKKFGVPN
jgi:tetratricopeptide (TPR) repeat protein